MANKLELGLILLLLKVYAQKKKNMVKKVIFIKKAKKIFCLIIISNFLPKNLVIFISLIISRNIL